MQSQGKLKVAIIGSGPAGFFAAEALLSGSRGAVVDMFDRLPVPFGLVRYGVAPDHQKLKLVTTNFEKIASNDFFRFFGNVHLGQTISLDELRPLYNAIIIATGAGRDRKLGIPGEELEGSISATDFVGWYNGHPDQRELDVCIAGKCAVVVGQGNVALDICRILAKKPDMLAPTDIARHSLHALRESNITEIVVIGRRGPAQAKFSAKELRELGDLEEWDVCINQKDLILNSASAREMADHRSVGNSKVLQLFDEFARRPRSKPKSIKFVFQASPVRFEGISALEKVVFERNELVGSPFEQCAVGTKEYFEVGAKVAIRCVGYSGTQIAGLSFHDRQMTIGHEDGRALNESGNVIPGVYVTGWIKRGPSGVIGSNRVDSIATVASLLEDSMKLETPTESDVVQLLAQKKVRWTSFDDWRHIDAVERDEGARIGCVRRKIVDPEIFLTFAGECRHAGASHWN